MIKRTHYVDEIMKFVNLPFTKILTGVRRCGKSTILSMIVEELKQKGIDESQILIYNFDSMAYIDLLTPESLYRELTTKMKNQTKRFYLFFDEIQEVKEWEKVINSIMNECNVDIFVTGSNSRMMSSEISTYLTGRYVNFRIYPLSFCEYLEFERKLQPLEDLHSALFSYIKSGGFPATHLYDITDEERYTIVKDIYQSTVFSDIVKRNQIRKVDQLERIVKYVFDNIGNTFSAQTISKYMKNEHRSMNVETIYEYLNKLEQAYIIQRCMRYDIKGKEILKTQEKFYLADPSLRYAVLGYRPDTIASMLENVVYLELRRKGYEVYVGKLDGKEIDFVAVKENEKLYIQICLRIETKETMKREYENLLEIKDNYPKYVLRLDEFGEGNYEGIKTMHVADFLLHECE